MSCLGSGAASAACCVGGAQAEGRGAASAAEKGRMRALGAALVHRRTRRRHRAFDVPPIAGRQHDVDAHGVPANAISTATDSSTHQPRSWSKAEAWPRTSSRIACDAVEAPGAEVLIKGRSLVEHRLHRLHGSDLPAAYILIKRRGATKTISFIVVTPEVTHAPMSSLKEAAAVLQVLQSRAQTISPCSSPPMCPTSRCGCTSPWRRRCSRATG